MPTYTLDPLDVGTIVAYLLLTLGIGFWVARKNETTEDYFLAGRQLTWPLIGFSLFATNISSSSLIGLAGAAYSSGIAVYNYEWFAVVVLVLFIFFFLPLYLRTRIYTIPEYLERRYDGRVRLFVSGLTITGNVLLEIAGALYSGALVILLLFPQASFGQIVVGLALLTGVYTILGGLRAVVYTDTMQAVLLLIGACIITVAVMTRVTWEEVVAVTTPLERSLLQPASDPNLPWTGLVTGLPLLGIYYWCNNQYIVQRALGAKDLDHGRWGALFAGFLKLPVLFIMVFPGLYAKVLYPGLATPDQVYPTLMFELLPAGLRGLLIVALLAALMSSLSSTFNSVSTLVTMDFAKRFRPQASEASLVRIGRIATFVVMVLGMLWAPQIQQFPSLWAYLQGVLAYITPPIVASFLVGVFWKRATANGAFAALMAGSAVALGLAFTQVGWHFLHIAAVLFLVSVAVLVAVSLLDRRSPSQRLEDLMWTPSLWRVETAHLRGRPWYANYRIQAALLLALTAVIVGLFL